MNNTNRIKELLNKNFIELTNEEITELTMLLKENDIDVDVIDDVTLETIRAIFEEDLIMNETATTMNNEEVTMGDMAKAFAEASKEKLEKGFEFVVENVDAAANEVKKMANMNEEQLEIYLKANGKSVLDKIIDGVKNFANNARKEGEEFSFFKDALDERADKADSVVILIKDILDEEELSGWGKFKGIVKELIKWVLRVLLKIGAIVLKLAITVVVGVVKIGATALVTCGKTVGVINKEIITPLAKSAKKAWEQRKVVYVDNDDEFDDVEEMLFDK